jgi:hypothetical protein
MTLSSQADSRSQRSQRSQALDDFHEHITPQYRNTSAIRCGKLRRAPPAPIGTLQDSTTPRWWLMLSFHQKQDRLFREMYIS